jgi:alpha-L-rhamnosidase
VGTGALDDHVNGLPGYSAWWVVSEAEYLRRWGDIAAVREQKAHLLEVLARMDAELDARGVYVAASGRKPFVDWSKGFSADSPEARRATDFEYVLAYRNAAWLLRQLSDTNEAAKQDARADVMTAAAQKYLSEGATFGDRWQTNAIAVLAGATTPAQRDAAWSDVLSRTVKGRKSTDVITPYYGDYVLNAMATLGKRREALEWMRGYWGGMLDAGATSFWEAWDPAWAGDDTHAKLQADDKVGYNASLAHGWAAGPAAWLMEEVLGVKALEPGFKRTQIRPELAGLEWAKGGVATPLGVVGVDVRAGHYVVTIPAGMEAEVLLPAGRVKLDGAEVKVKAVEDGTRQRVVLRHAGRFSFDFE